MVALWRIESLPQSTSPASKCDKFVPCILGTKWRKNMILAREEITKYEHVTEVFRIWKRGNRYRVKNRKECWLCWLLIQLVDRNVVKKEQQVIAFSLNFSQEKPMSSSMIFISVLRDERRRSPWVFEKREKEDNLLQTRGAMLLLEWTQAESLLWPHSKYANLHGSTETRMPFFVPFVTRAQEEGSKTAVAKKVGEREILHNFYAVTFTRCHFLFEKNTQNCLEVDRFCASSD